MYSGESNSKRKRLRGCARRREKSWVQKFEKRDGKGKHEITKKKREKDFSLMFADEFVELKKYRILFYYIHPSLDSLLDIVFDLILPFLLSRNFIRLSDEARIVLNGNIVFQIDNLFLII